jgi:hypothetical protein
MEAMTFDPRTLLLPSEKFAAILRDMLRPQPAENYCPTCRAPADPVCGTCGKTTEPRP